MPDERVEKGRKHQRHMVVVNALPDITRAYKHGIADQIIAALDAYERERSAGTCPCGRYPDPGIRLGGGCKCCDDMDLWIEEAPESTEQSDEQERVLKDEIQQVCDVSDGYRLELIQAIEDLRIARFDADVPLKELREENERLIAMMESHEGCCQQSRVLRETLAELVAFKISK